MEAEKAHKYWDAITVIEAQNMLTAMNVAQYPELTKSDAQGLHRKISSLAYPVWRDQVVETITADEMARLINYGG